MTAYGLMFHHFHAPGALYPIVQGSLSGDDLERIITKTPGLLDAQAWLAGALAGTLPDDACVLTFDDGLACQAAVALPVLEAHGLTAIWSLYTQQPNPLEVDRWTRTVLYDNLAHYYARFFLRAGALVPLGRACAESLGYLTAHRYLSDEDRLFRWLRDIGLTPTQYREIADDLRELVAPGPLAGYQWLWMSPETWRQLHAAGHVLALHSHTHPTRPEGVNWVDEFVTNLQALAAAVPGWTPRVASYPCNLGDRMATRALEVLGVAVAFDATRHEPRGLLHIPREDSADAIKRVRK